ncbi:hypothetical protein [Clostridium sp. ZBS18]|uniref:hypothetical protein n=1 Tax=Clostridium sp. ZBS18 TaxID=2949967 RepID=UPI00207AC911|nr:hypothetical protein [Clostridium sp. ZBS18]
MYRVKFNESYDLEIKTNLGSKDSLLPKISKEVEEFFKSLELKYKHLKLIKSKTGITNIEEVENNIK